MSDRQVYGLTLLLIGLALLIVSVGIAWALSLRSRRRRVEGAWIITSVSFVLFALGVLICWLGVTAIVEG
jgi:site-specific recombinase